MEIFHTIFVFEKEASRFILQGIKNAITGKICAVHGDP